jgi:hypothetical protein
MIGLTTYGNKAIPSYSNHKRPSKKTDDATLGHPKVWQWGPQLQFEIEQV